MKELLQVFGIVWLSTAVLFSMLYAFVFIVPFGILDVVVASTFTSTFSIVYVLTKESKELMNT